MPGTIQQTDELDDRSVTTNQQVGRDLDARYGFEIGVRRMIETIAKEVFYFRTTELPGRQADIVDDEQGDSSVLRAWAKVR